MSKTKSFPIWKWVLLSAVTGVAAGTSASAFLWLLQWATETRVDHPQCLWLLPVLGLVSGLAYHRFGGSAERGSNLILDEIHNPKRTVPARMAPMVLLGTVLTHLGGGSAGREGTAVQMGASLADQISRGFGVRNGDRKVLLVAGTGAGFGAAIGAPWAGALFGMEVIYVSGLKPFAAVECLIAAWVGYGTTKVLRAPHSHFESVVLPELDLRVAGVIVLAGVLFGLAAWTFVRAAHFIEHLYESSSIPRWLRPVCGGVILVSVFSALGTDRYAGLGIPVIQSALKDPESVVTPLLKGLFTAITVSSGFKGGEFVPLVFVGATLGSALSVWLLPGAAGFLGALGFAATFGGAANTPLACAVMAAEIFGLAILPCALAVCLVAYACSGHRGIYRAQKLNQSKAAHARALLGCLGELPGRVQKSK